MTASQRVDLDPCFVLHQRAWRETSLIVEVFSTHSGRLGLVARGARRASSPLRGLLQPFVPLLVSWSDRGELGTLRAAEVDGVALPLSGRGLAGGLYLNELIMRLVHRHDPHPGLLLDYRRALSGLREGTDIEPVLRVFEKRLLSAVGYGLLLEREAGSEVPVRDETRYRYVPEQGPVVDARGESPGIDVSGATLLALSRESLESAEHMREAKRLMRYLLDRLLGPRPIASRMLFRSSSSRDTDPIHEASARRRR